MATKKNRVRPKRYRPKSWPTRNQAVAIAQFLSTLDTGLFMMSELTGNHLRSAVINLRHQTKCALADFLEGSPAEGAYRD